MNAVLSEQTVTEHSRDRESYKAFYAFSKVKYAEENLDFLKQVHLPFHFCVAHFSSTLWLDLLA